MSGPESRVALVTTPCAVFDASGVVSNGSLEMAWAASDPAAAFLVLHIDAELPRYLHVARSLLLAGLDCPAFVGFGVVRIRKSGGVSAQLAVRGDGPSCDVVFASCALSDFLGAAEEVMMSRSIEEDAALSVDLDRWLAATFPAP